MMKFRALRYMKIGDKQIAPNDIFYAIDNRDWISLVRLGSAELIDDVKEQVDLTVKQDPTIVKAGPRWRKVMLGETQIGKSVKTDEEALAIIATWEEENK
jgi:hypothetical protein